MSINWNLSSSSTRFSKKIYAKKIVRKKCQADKHLDEYSKKRPIPVLKKQTTPALHLFRLN